jgi:hypothetical protein
MTASVPAYLFKSTKKTWIASIHRLLGLTWKPSLRLDVGRLQSAAKAPDDLTLVPGMHRQDQPVPVS